MTNILREDEGLSAALDLVAPGGAIYLNGAGSFPLRFAEALTGSELEGITVGHPMRRTAREPEPDYLDAPSSRFLHVSDFTFDPPVRRAVHEGRAAFRPGHAHDAALSWGDSYGDFAFVSSASPPDAHGYCSLGLFGGYGIPFARSPRAISITLEINEEQPRLHGDVALHLSEVDCAYQVDYPLRTEPEPPEPTAIQHAIAENVCELIPDGATLQIGAGVVPELIASGLIRSGRRGLGIHSEGLFGSMVGLLESGVVDNNSKSIHRHKSVIALAIGDEHLRNYVDDNPGIAMLPMDYVNDPSVIAKNSRQVAVNGAVEVDLLGQCSSETIHAQHYSGVGGQWAFLYGASRAPGGRGIVALPSTTSDGASRIVSRLPVGTPVTVTRHDVQYVATEHGVASLRGKTVPDRVRELVAVAHPDHREGLMSDARDARLIR